MASIVTGASRGIGRAVSLAFAAQGADVALAGRDAQALDEVAKEIRERGGKAIALVVDVSDRKSVSKMVDEVLGIMGKVDILVNNAGILRPSLMKDITEEQWDEVMGVHLKGTFNCCQAVLDSMMKRNYGKIINVSAPSALRGSMGVIDYASAKAGIIAFTKNLAKELAPYHINVNCIVPVAETEMAARLENFWRTINLPTRGRIPLGRRPAPEEVAPAFVFLASHDSDVITGQVLAVDGGLTA